MIQVSEARSNECPYCGYVMGDAEGCSEMGTYEGICTIWCARCGVAYYYNIGNTISWHACTFMDCSITKSSPPKPSWRV